MLPYTAAEMGGPGHGCHLVVYNQAGFGTAHSWLLTTGKQTISGHTMPGLGAET